MTPYSSRSGHTTRLLSITLFHFIFIKNPNVSSLHVHTYLSPILPGTPKTASKSPNNTSCKLKQKRLPQCST
ncbi:hypothetical protein K435DRAFT_786752 [Dendrothele bispora CBS 962.96]|uniref:Uncharacterized protein n=1 Tax=Dendrothele bispora (strain CBS 962.96) TaxID=1314807 RepID=A0A4S8KQ06_DENBC|nr:hypothetical protein K435DRAFT_786752 [Dendrothele bispora CBS 962.96]